ncbi:ABC transporter substrate-binding protein [Desulfobacterales bacterium HSG2]|nr:ABC transporter substrate-binding protein [Desulfobacterales bacterium HSG2]
MKKILLILLSVLCLGVIIILLLPRTSPFKLFYQGKEPIHIAVAGPMNNRTGKAILMGINLYLDEVNSQGGIDGRKMELLTFDDKNDKGTAVKVASEIADQGKALLVLGHYYSLASFAAGKIYRKNQIPAITASATAEAVTLKNDWYFRVVPNNTVMASFIASYVNRCLKITSASILYADDSYGLSLAEAFEKTAEKLGISIKKKWRFDKVSDDELKRFMKDLEATDNPGMLFMAMHSDVAPKIVKLLKDRGKTWPIIGADSFSSRMFIGELKTYHKEQAAPGYYSDGIYCTSFYMGNVGSEKAYFFEKKFLRKYNMRPSSESACYYDAMHVAAEAIKKAGIRDKKHIRGDRKKVRETLAGFYSRENAIRGITGDIYFDTNGDALRPCSIGVYENQKLLPSFLQYQQLSKFKDIDNIFKKALEGEVIVIEGKTMSNTWVVYAGIHINEVSPLDVRNSAYSADFYLWFRFQEDFNDADIQFMNLKLARDKTVPGNLLGQPIREEIKNGITTRIYHVRADFETEFDFHAYPFDRHSVSIRFHHADWTRDKLIYVPDTRGLPAVQPDIRKGEIKIDTGPGWNTDTDIISYESIISKISSLGNPNLSDSEYVIAYSQFNAVIRIKREHRSIIRTFLPVMGIAVFLCLIHFISPARLRTRVLTSMGAVAANTAYYLKIMSDLSVEYLTVVEYALFTVYVLAVISVLMSIFVYNLHEQGAGRKRKMMFFIYAGRILYPLLVLSAGLLLVFLH